MSDSEEDPQGAAQEQAWLFANLDKEQYQWTQRFEDGLGIFWNFHKYGPGYPYHIYPDFDVIDLLARTPLQWPRRTALADEVNTSLEGIRRTENCRLAGIPTELHLRLFENLEFVDALCLAHTCRYFWLTGYHRLFQLVCDAQAPWAGDRLLCIGSHAERVPSSIEFPEWIPEAINKYIAEDPENGEPRPLYDVIEEIYEEVYTTSPLDYGSLMNSSPTAKAQIAACVSQAKALGKSGTSVMSKIINGNHHSQLSSSALEDSSANRGWALRNLNTGEYVTLKGIAMNPSRIIGTSSRYDQIDLLSVLLYRNTWSTIDVTGSKHRGLHQGPWAGHRFNVSPVWNILEDKSKAWKDISKEVREELYNIAVSDGKEWAEAYKRGDPIDCQALRDAS